MKPKYLHNWVIIISLTAATWQSNLANSLTLEDAITAKNEIIFADILGDDVSVLSTYYTENETLMLLLEGVVDRSIPVEGVEGVSDVVNVVEISITDPAIVAEYYAAAPDEETEVDFKHLVYSAALGEYFIYDALSNSMLSYSFLEPEAQIIEVEKVRLVEVPIELPPEPVVEEVETEEVVEEVPEEIEEPAIDETLVVEEEIITEEVVEESVVELTEEAEETEAVEEMIEAAADEVDEQADEKIAEEVATEETLIEVVEETEEVNDEVEEIVEEVVEAPNAIEFPQPTSKWVEETYIEEETIYVNRFFGTPVGSYPLDVFSEGEIRTLANTEAGDIQALFIDAEGVLKQYGINVSTGNLNLTELKAYPENLAGVSAMAIDPVSSHMLYSLSGQSILAEYTTDSILIKRHEIPFLYGATDIRFMSLTDEMGAISDWVLRVFTHAGMIDLDWGRFDQNNIRWVPGQYATLQSAVADANEDDWVLISPGQYAGGATLNTGSINISSLYAITSSETFIKTTRISGGGTTALTLGSAADAMISHVSIEGFETGIQSEGTLTVDGVILSDNGDAINCSGGTAFIQNSTIQNSRRSGILYSDATASLVEYNTITGNQQHGITVIITPYNRVLYRSVFRKNRISENGDSGIYFEDDTIITNREFRIENNFLTNNGIAGIQVYLQQPDPRNRLPEGPRRIEPHFIVNNTIAGNPTGIFNGGNFKVINNIIAQSEEVGILNLRYHSLVIRNLFWENGENSVDSNYNARGNVEEDPLFTEDGSYELMDESPAIGVGIRGNLWNDDSDRSGNTLGANI